MRKKGKKGDLQPTGPATVRNRRARYDYEISETHEAGIALVGPEVKSVYAGNVQLAEGFCKVEAGELWLHNVYIAPYEQASHFNVDPRRPRKLLMHREEIRRIGAKAQEKGLTIIPLRVYFANGRAKVEIGLGRGKRKYDKREQIARKEERRERERYEG
jgi:SsrA-binding protein